MNRKKDIIKMDDLISKSELIKELAERAVMHYEDWKAFKDYMGDRKVIHSSKLDECKMISDIIAATPPVEAVPVVHGRWIIEERAGVDYWCCSECHKIKSEYYAKPKDNFCGNCGADMRKKV